MWGQFDCLICSESGRRKGSPNVVLGDTLQVVFAGIRMFQSCIFEVFGRVQGVYFRKHTQEEAERLGLVGWVMNKPQGTVQGEMQGPKEAVDKMKKWLSSTGSPMSVIEKAEFGSECEVDHLSFTAFEIKR